MGSCIKAYNHIHPANDHQALPLPVVWRLQMSTAHRIGLNIIFALGLV